MIGKPCGCGECIQAGVANEPTRRDPVTRRLLHGYDLRRGLDAFKRFQEVARAAVGPKSARGGVFKKLAGER